MKATSLNNNWEATEPPISPSEKFYKVIANVLFVLLIWSLCYCVAISERKSDNKNITIGEIKA